MVVSRSDIPQPDAESSLETATTSDQYQSAGRKIDDASSLSDGSMSQSFWLFDDKQPFSLYMTITEGEGLERFFQTVDFSVRSRSTEESVGQSVGTEEEQARQQAGNHLKEQMERYVCLYRVIMDGWPLLKLKPSREACQMTFILRVLDLKLAHMSTDSNYVASSVIPWDNALDETLAESLKAAGVEPQSFEVDWNDLRQWPGKPRDVTWTTGCTTPGTTLPASPTSIDLKIAIFEDVPAEKFFAITYRFGDKPRLDVAPDGAK